MKIFRILLTAMLLLAFLTTSPAVAKGGDNEKVYLFGYGQSFKDSTVFLTPIAELPQSELNGKTKFLEHQATYAKQMERFLQSQGVAFCTCVLFYDTNKEKLEKRLKKLREHVIKEEQFSIQNLSPETFTFTLQAEPTSTTQP